MNILTFAPPHLHRADQVAALELLAFAANKRRISTAIKDRMDTLYETLWSGGANRDEIANRQEVDDLLSPQTGQTE